MKKTPTPGLSRMLALWLLFMGAAVFGPKNIASFYPEELASRTAASWGYVLDHAVGGLAAMSLLALAARFGIARAAPHLVAVWLWLAIEQLQASACRVVFPMDRAPPKTGSLQGLCDIATGLPIYMLTLAAVLLRLLVMLQQLRDKS